MDRAEIERYLKALDAQLKATGLPETELIVCGGAAMMFTVNSERNTADIDILEVVVRGENGCLEERRPVLSEELEKAIHKVAADYGLPWDWLNIAAGWQVNLGLPDGFEERVFTRSYGNRLTVHFVSRFDLLCLKMLAFLDRGFPRDLDDIEFIEPQDEEVKKAAEWCLSKNVTPIRLTRLIKEMGYGDVTQGLP